MDAWLNRAILSNHVLVWFGLISFPLYLWHWSLLSFARIIESEKPSQSIRIAVILISIVLAWLTYKLIEKPIRFGSHSKVKTITLVVLMMAIGYIGYNCYKQKGFTFRTAAQPQVQNDGDIGHDIFHKYHHQKFYLCTPITIQKEALTWYDSIRCFQSKENKLIKIAIIGDSHAEHLFIGLAEALAGINIVYYTKGSLPYINNKEFEHIFQYVINDLNIRTVILSAAWPRKPRKDIDIKSELDKTIKQLTAANKNIYLADDVPSFSFDPQKCKYSRKFSQNDCTENSKVFYAKSQTYYLMLQEIIKNNPNVKILKMRDYFCDKNFCNMAKDGILFYRDRNHLNINGSRYLGRKIIDNNPQLAD
jgi:hypothetical protein